MDGAKAIRAAYDAYDDAKAAFKFRSSYPPFGDPVAGARWQKELDDARAYYELAAQELGEAREAADALRAELAAARG